MVESNQSYSNERVRDLLVDLFEKYESSFGKYQWPWENQRWFELVFCILSTIDEDYSADSKAALATRVLVDLGLLDIHSLAESITTDGKSDYSNPYAMHFRSVLERVGFEAKEINQVFTTICETAKTLEQSYKGKIQILLRHHTDQIVNQLSKVLHLSHYLGEKNSRITILRWLQNILNIPILVPSQGLSVLCETTGKKPEDVLAIVDDLDINVALLDEVLNRWVQGK